ncbi:putative protein phosphatase methylesterase 1 [Paratrimastix pyriformis]|uniref:protein phosphatase methylesterase-1 n=1 Tax=Paratrimastix pyriformis TaxID=342808 RepID=A0ABQ8UB99_9EUKA|nr:putative protein phosphatase methylesterase 1 [Paratrimastix pyriformis]
MQAPPPRRQSQDPLQDPMQYYHESLTVDTEDGSRFRVYRGGRSEGGTVLFLLHGAGHCAMSWAFFTKEMRDAAKIVAMDLRGHGATQTSTESDMSLSRLAQDVIEVIQKLCPSDPLVLFGHSMGGAVAVQCAALGTLPQLKGLFVLDVVEGTALESLALLPAFLKDRPTWFPTLEAAVEWVSVEPLQPAPSSRPSAAAHISAQLLRARAQSMHLCLFLGWVGGFCPIHRFSLLAAAGLPSPQRGQRDPQSCLGRGEHPVSFRATRHGVDLANRPRGVVALLERSVATVLGSVGHVSPSMGWGDDRCAGFLPYRQ